MPKIQIIQQQTSPNNLGPAPSLRAERVTSAFGESAAGIARGLGEIQQGVQAEMQADVFEARALRRQEENDAAAWAGKVLSDTRLQWQETLIKSQESAEPGAAGFTPKFLSEFDKYKEETLRGAPNETSRQYLAERLTSIRTELGGSALTFEANARRDYRIDQTKTTIGNNAKIAQDRPEDFSTVYAETVAVIDAMDIPPIEKSALLASAKDNLSYAAVLGRLQRDPVGTAARIRGSVKSPVDKAASEVGAKADFKDTMKFIFDKEGGYNPNDGNGPVNFGINQAANPDVDVKSLTKTKAESIYKDRYWDAIGADKLPAGVALMAMDTAVNQGVAFAKKLLNASGGDITKMAEMRREKYAELIQKNPARYSKYGKAWGDRVADAEKQALALGGSGIGELDVTQITPDKITQTGDPAVDMLSFDQRLKLLQYADTLGNQQMALAKEQLRGKLQDFTAMAKSGVPIPDGQIPTPNELTAAYGADGMRMYNDEVKPMLTLNNDLQRFSTMSIGERNAFIASKAPVPGAGFVGQSERYNIMLQANEALNKQLTDDPAAYATRYSETVNKAWTTLQQTTSDDMAAKSRAATAYVNATLAEQNRLGVLAPTVVPKNVADSIVRQFFQQADGGQSAAVLMEQQANLWGKNWPAIYNQIAKDLPGSALVIGSGLKPATSEMLARASTMKQTELEDGLVKSDVTAMKDKLQESLTDFRTSVAPLAGGAQTFNVFNEQITKLATMYMRGGETASKASERAYQEVIGSKYEFISNRNNSVITYRVPMELDPSRVAKGADKIMQIVGSLDIEPPASLASLDKAQSKQAFAEQLRSEGYWVTANDNSGNAEAGLALYINGRAVMDSKGKPVFKSWADLQNADNAPRSATGALNVPTIQDFEGLANVYGAP